MPDTNPPIDLPEPFVIREGRHRIHDPISPEKLDLVGASLRLPAESTVLDLACGSGEMLCRWSRDLGFRGRGVDISSAFVAAAVARADQLGVSDRVRFEHGDAAGHVATEPVDVACCLGATWIGGGLLGTLDLLERSLRPGGLLVVGEPYWRHERRDDEFGTLPDLLGSFRDHGHDLVGMVLASPDDWDRYVAPQWLATRRWLDAHPDHELWAEMRTDLDDSPTYHLDQREHLGWGVFTLCRR